MDGVWNGWLSQSMDEMKENHDDILLKIKSDERFI